MGFKDLAHDSAVGHVTGQSVFIADRPEQKSELWVEVLYSTRAHAKIKHLNFEAAKKIEGVAGIFTSQDLAHNRWGSIVQDQPLLAEAEVHYFGEPIAVVAAKDQNTAIKAKNAIEVDYEPLEAVLTLKQAKKQQFYMGETYRIACGDAASALELAAHTLSGEFVSAGQEQFYLESQASIAYPDENDCLIIHSSAQHPTEVQHVVAKALGLQQQQVVCKVKRMGGGFGGKESQSAHYAALAALV
ncbi:MAG: molybdopterin cofactor-binding domain-containing protein, partial [bacterium]